MKKIIYLFIVFVSIFLGITALKAQDVASNPICDVTAEIHYLIKSDTEDSGTVSVRIATLTDLVKDKEIDGCEAFQQGGIYEWKLPTRDFNKFKLNQLISAKLQKMSSPSSKGVDSLILWKPVSFIDAKDSEPLPDWTEFQSNLTPQNPAPPEKPTPLWVNAIGILGIIAFIALIFILIKNRKKVKPEEIKPGLTQNEQMAALASQNPAPISPQNPQSPPSSDIQTK